MLKGQKNFRNGKDLQVLASKATINWKDKYIIHYVLGY